MGKKFKYGTTSIFEIALIAGILVLVNIFSLGTFRRVDLTQNREYTISKQTKMILSELDDIVNVKVFISSELPPEFTSMDRQIRDMMEEFQAYSNSNFRLKFIDPKEDERYLQETQMANIPEVSFQVMKKDQMQVMKAYMGILIEHENKTESIPFVSSVDNLEYDLMSRIVKVLQKESELPTIGILQGHNEPSTQQPNQQQNTPPGPLALFVTSVREQFKVQDITLDDRDKISESVNTLVVVNPETIPEYQLWMIDQFVMNGGKLICFLNGMTGLEDLNKPPTVFTSGIEVLLNNWGVKVNNDLVCDKNAETAQFRTGQFSYIQKLYPFWIKIQQANFSRENPITGALESATFHWPSSLEIQKDKLEGIQVVELVKSSESSWRMTKDFNISPLQDFNTLPTGDKFLLGVMLSGSFSSYFTGKPTPVKPDGTPVGGKEQVKQKSETTEIAVFSTGHLVQNHVWDQRQGSSEDRTLVQNALDYLNIGDELIGIRSRQSTNRPLEKDKIETERQRVIIRVINLALVPFLVILFGISKFWLKTARKKRFEKDLKDSDKK
jgi:ABC-2 type transport system permease protein